MWVLSMIIHIIARIGILSSGYWQSAISGGEKGLLMYKGGDRNV